MEELDSEGRDKGLHRKNELRNSGGMGFKGKETYCRSNGWLDGLKLDFGDRGDCLIWMGMVFFKEECSMGLIEHSCLAFVGEVR